MLCYLLGCWLEVGERRCKAGILGLLCLPANTDVVLQS